MTNQFEHVMVLTSIIIGFAITNVLSGAGAVIERVSGTGERLRTSRAHAFWVAYVFVWLVSFWWWQFRLLDIVTVWTMGRYLFIIFYAVLLYLLVVVLIPSDWDSVTDLDDYFLSKRYWFFGLFLLATAVDVGDTLLKGGWAYMYETGPFAWVLVVATLPVCAIGVRSTNLRTHTLIAAIMMVWQVLVSFNAFPRL